VKTGFVTLRALTALTLAALAGCSAQSDDGAAGDEAEINVDQAPVTTGLTELRAGQPYVPGIDESPLAIGDSGCVSNPKVSLTGGDVTATANVVTSRNAMGRELGLDLSGIPIPVGGVPGLTAGAGLAISTTFDSQSAVVLFQSTGKYESVVTGADAMTKFDPTKTGQCGYGFISRAAHRVGAALSVTVKSTNKSKNVKANVSGGTGSAQVKASIGQLIEQGQLEISLRFAADPIPGLPAAPFGDAVLSVGNTPEDKAAANQKLNTALTWLGNAQAAISTYLLDLRANPDKAPPAPTQQVVFKFYPGTPSSVRTAISDAAKAAQNGRKALAQAIAIETTWRAFEKDAADGMGHRWNIPGAPVRSANDLVGKQREMLGGKLKNYEDAIGASLDRCSDAIRNDLGQSESELMSALKRDCKEPAAAPYDARQFDVRPIAAVSVDETGDKDHERACPPNQRRPSKRDMAIFIPWSQHYASQTGGKNGIYFEEESCAFGASWLVNGREDCSPTFGGAGLRICLAGEPLPAP
jgi:hypothetical protein